ncbi:MAG TPA: molybdopterin converting factor subunit 1 [Candidatus Xenobia bacterium]|nr:molybdopterin converting factor subunit 1 [Candidatus Xenobia bacterium]
MNVKVLFFGQLRELVGASEESVELPAGASVADLISHYQERVPRLRQFRPSLAVAVNQEYADAAAALRSGDEVAFLPPVSGGSPTERIELTRAPIEREALVAGVKAPPDGAVVVFEGIVRNHSAGRETLYLDYEAYEPMALAKMREIAAELRKRYPIDGLAMVHRLGRLQIGETSVLIAASAAHRAAAFEACRAAIDTLKRTVPIWKKEYFADGAVWAEGEVAAPIADPARQP